MLCEEPGCHLLAIVIVNLTFGDEELNRDLLTMDADGGDLQLVDCLGYALLVSLLLLPTAFAFRAHEGELISLDRHHHDK